MYTNQSAFNKVWQWFVIERHGQFICKLYLMRTKYRGHNGLKCPVGVLIPDEEYKHEMEGALPGGGFEKINCLQGLTSDYLLALQNAHDSPRSNEFADSIEGNLRNVAKLFNLNVPE